jgi:hypothetical protein
MEDRAENGILSAEQYRNRRRLSEHLDRLRDRHDPIDTAHRGAKGLRLQIALSKRFRAQPLASLHTGATA